MSPHTYRMLKQQSASLANPEWSPSHADLERVFKAVARRAAWAEAMANEGVKVLPLQLSAAESARVVDEWHRSRNEAVQDSLDR